MSYNYIINSLFSIIDRQLKLDTQSNYPPWPPLTKYVTSQILSIKMLSNNVIIRGLSIPPPKKPLLNALVIFVQDTKSVRARAWSSTTLSLTLARCTGTTRKCSNRTGSSSGGQKRSRASGNRNTSYRSAPANGRASDSSWCPDSGLSLWPVYSRGTMCGSPTSCACPRPAWACRLTRTR